MGAQRAMTWAMYDGLAAACAAINENSYVRVAVLRGAGGKAFIAGTRQPAAALAPAIYGATRLPIAVSPP